MSEERRSRRDVLRAVPAVALGIAGVDGVPGRPVQSTIGISDWDDLNAVRYTLDGDYELLNDLNRETAAYDTHVAFGTGWEPIGELLAEIPRAFSGTFTGNGYEIADLAIDRPVKDGVGLFEFSEGTIEGVDIVNCEVRGDSVVGGLVGFVSSSGTVNGCTASGAVSGDAAVGSLVGRHRGTMSECGASGDVNGGNSAGGLVGQVEDDGTVERGSAAGDVRGEDDIGGLVGQIADDGLVSQCSAAGDVRGENNVGGLVGRIADEGTVNQVSARGNVDGRKAGGLLGRHGGTASEAYATGDVNGGVAGGLVGRNIGGTANETYATGEVTGSDAGGVVGFFDPFPDGAVQGYWDTESTGRDDGIGRVLGDGTEISVAGLPTEEMQGDTTMERMVVFDFESVWVPTDGYPILQFQDVGVEAYADDNTATVETNGLAAAITDWRTGRVKISLLRDVVAAWKRNDRVGGRS